MRVKDLQRWIICGAAATATIALAAPARATYPGGNGEIAYNVIGGSELAIRAIEPDGSGDHRLSIAGSNAGDAEYTPDGTSVVIAEWGRHGRIVLQDLSTSERAVILGRRELPGDIAWSLGVSPDGTLIVFCSRLGAGLRLFTVGVDGSDLTKISRGTDDCHADWGSNDRIVATQELRSGRRRVFHMAPDGSDRQAVVTLPAPGSWSIEYFVVPNWAPAASRILFGAQLGRRQSDIWGVNPDGSAFTHVTRTQRVDEYGPLWAPDSSGIAYTAARIKRNPRRMRGDLWSAAPDGLDASRITDTRRDEYSRSWQAILP